MTSSPYSLKQILTTHIFLVCAVALYAFFPLTVTAQLSLAGGGTTITLSPSTPMPESTVTARVDSYDYDINSARISWSVDGSLRADAADAREITLTMPPLGTPISISVTVTEASGVAHTATTRVSPSALDLVVEGDTRVPYFYKGAALPSAGSGVRLIAQPSLYTPQGSLVPQSDIIYSWSVDGKVVKSGRAQSLFTSIMPRSGDLEVLVTATSLDGTARHTRLERVHAARPLNYFYEDNPLYGMSRNVLPQEFTLNDEEISVRAEPYFVSTDIFKDALYSWSINGRAVKNPNADPQVLTLRKTGAGGSANIAFSIRNMNAFLQAALGTFTIYFD